MGPVCYAGGLSRSTAMRREQGEDGAGVGRKKNALSWGEEMGLVLEGRKRRCIGRKRWGTVSKEKGEAGGRSKDLQGEEIGHR